MARDYAKFSPRFWTGETGRKLRENPNAQRLAAYLFTSPSSTMTGLYYVPFPTIGYELGMSLPDVRAALAFLQDIDFAYYDHNQDLAWVPSMAEWQIDEELHPNDNRIKGIRRELGSFRWHPFVEDFWRRYGVAFHLGEAPPRPSSTPSKGIEMVSSVSSGPLRSQDQDQDQEHEQEEEREPLACDPSGPGTPPDTGPRLTCDTLLRLFGGIRSEITKTNLGWVTPKPKDGKGETFADDLRAAKVSSALVAETMRRFLARAKSGEYGTESGKMLTEPSFGFECWMRRFQGIREELEGVTPKTPDIRKTGPPRGSGGPYQRTAANIEAVGDLLRSGGDR